SFTSNTLNNKHKVKIKSDDNITIAPKSKVKLKIYITSENIQNQYAIMPTEHREKYLTLQTQIIDKSDEVILYNHSNVYSNISKGMTIVTIYELNILNNKHESKKIKLNNETTTKEYDIKDDQGTIINISKELNNGQRKKTIKLINKFRHLFTSNPLNIGCANVEPCEIKLKSDKPIFQPPYRTLPIQREKLKTVIKGVGTGHLFRSTI
ncbi:serine/threonine-protein kinase fray2-like, partial [Aphis craccivora]